MTLPVYTCKVDWTLAGTFADASCDISSYVHSADIKEGESPDLGSGGNPSTMILTVKNTDGRFFPDNAAGPYYGNLVPSRPIWLYCTYAGVTYGLFAGYVKRITPYPNTKLVDIYCEDALARYRRIPVTLGAADRSARTLRGLILDGMGENAACRDLDIEDEMISQASVGTKGFDALAALNAATLTRHFIAAGTAEPAWYLYTTRNRNYKLDSSADESLTSASGFTGISGSAGWDVTDDTIVNYQSANLPNGTSVTSSATSYGATFAGADISSTYLTTSAQAGGLVRHITWRFADPRKRPSIEMSNVFPTMLRRQPYDVIRVSITEMAVSLKRFEIVGQSLRIEPMNWSAAWTLQETPEQGNPPSPAWFTLDTDALDGTARLAY